MWMFISSYANALGHLVCFTLSLNPSRVSSFHCSFQHFIFHFTCANALGHLVCFTLLLNPSRVTYFHYSFHHLITYILVTHPLLRECSFHHLLVLTQALWRLASTLRSTYSIDDWSSLLYIDEMWIVLSYHP